MTDKTIENKLHPVLDLADTVPLNDAVTIPEGIRYDTQLGAWIVEGSTQLYVDLPNRPFMSTKKRDIETGEDQKGT